MHCKLLIVFHGIILSQNDIHVQNVSVLFVCCQGEKEIISYGKCHLYVIT